MQHDCDLDVADKHHTQGIDDMAHQLRNRSCKIGFHPGIEKHDNTSVILNTIYLFFTYLITLFIVVSSRRGSEHNQWLKWKCRGGRTVISGFGPLLVVASPKTTELTSLSGNQLSNIHIHVLFTTLTRIFSHSMS